MNVTNATTTPISTTAPPSEEVPTAAPVDGYDASQAPPPVLPTVAGPNGAGVVDGTMRLVRDAGLDPLAGVGRSIAELIMLLLIRAMRSSDERIREKVDTINAGMDTDPSRSVDVQVVELNRLTDERQMLFDALSNCVQAYDRNAKQAASEVGQR
ncbi:MAG: hypothetical protein RMA76_43335 [Deltaproteobacteria bacterium]|jgi:hypothetical protein